MARGIINDFFVAADIAVATDIVLNTTGLTSPIAANETQKLRWWVPFSVGATGGAQFQIVVPAAGTLFLATIKFINTVTDLLIATPQSASAAVGNALANAATHYVEIEAFIINGATAGNVDLQFAQNSSDALTLTILRGGHLRAAIL